MSDQPNSDAGAPNANPNAPKRVVGGRPVLPKIVGRPYIPGTERGENFPGERAANSDQAYEAPGWSDVPEGTEPDEGVAVEPVRGTPVNPESMPAETMQFQHACCAAVRPNPVEADAQGKVQARPEPYLEWQGHTKPSAALGLYLIVVGLAAAGAFIFAWQGYGTPSLIFVGITALLLVYMLASFLITRSGLKSIRIVAHRHILEEKLERGRLFHVRLDTTGSWFPASLSVDVTERKAPGLRPVEHAAIPGAGQSTFKVRPQGRGLLTFAGPLVTAKSFDRLWLAEQHWRLRTTVEVEPSLPGVTWKALVTGYAPFDNGTPSSIVKLYRDIETEVVRDYSAGDRLRDVNWKFFSRMGKMIIRQRTTEGETTILFVIDTGVTMLLDQAGFRNLDMAVEIAQEMADAGLRRNHECGLLAFNEERIVDHVRPTRAKTQIKRVIAHLQNLADHHLPEEGEDPVEITLTGDPENLRLGFGQGIKQRSTAGMTMVFFTDLQSTPEEIVQSVSKAAQSGQRVAVMLLPQPRLRPVQRGRRSQAEEDAETRGTSHTNRMRELLIANGCEFMELNPAPEDFKLEAPLPEERPDDPKRPGPVRTVSGAVPDPKQQGRPGAPRPAAPRPPGPAGTKPLPRAALK